MKRIFALVLSFVFLLSCLVLPAGAMFDPSPVYQVQAASAYIVNTDTNIIVYDKDSTKQVSAGGLTKYMTLAVLLTNYADQLDNTCTSCAAGKARASATPWPAQNGAKSVQPWALAAWCKALPASYTWG